jgi:hypothetical protein
MHGRFFYNIEEVRNAFNEQLYSGHHSDCPCCGRHAQIYRRKFHASMALQLIRLYRMGGHLQFIHASKLILPQVSGAGDFSKAKYWGLIIPKDKAIYETETPGKANGYWRITPLGEQFIKGLIRISREVHVFDDRVCGFSPDTITIRDALGTRFNYDELMDAAHV